MSFIESLRDVEARLKAALELRGKPGLTLGNVVVPVVLVQDASGPGWRAQVERSFMYAENVTDGGFTPKLFIQASTRPIAIDCIWIQSDLAGQGARIGIYGVGNSPVAVAQLNTRYIERLATSNEVAPVLTQPHNTDNNVYGIRIFQTPAIDTAIKVVETPGIVLLPTAGLCVSGTVAIAPNNFCVSFRGRVL